MADPRVVRCALDNETIITLDYNKQNKKYSHFKNANCDLVNRNKFRIQ